jgi:hypothetical protein
MTDRKQKGNELKVEGCEDQRLDLHGKSTSTPSLIAYRSRICVAELKLYQFVAFEIPRPPKPSLDRIKLIQLHANFDFSVIRASACQMQSSLKRSPSA